MISKSEPRSNSKGEFYIFKRKSLMFFEKIPHFLSCLPTENYTVWITKTLQFPAFASVAQVKQTQQSPAEVCQPSVSIPSVMTRNIRLLFLYVFQLAYQMAFTMKSSSHIKCSPEPRGLNPGRFWAINEKEQHLQLPLL